MAIEDVLQQLGEKLDLEIIPNLHGIARLMINEKLEVQFEVDVNGESLLIASFVSELPPGRFRERVLHDALKANHLIEENLGTLSYLGAENSLILTLNVPMHGLNGEDLYELLSIFVARATAWQSAIDNGHPSPPDTNEVPKGDGGLKTSLFGFQERD